MPITTWARAQLILGLPAAKQTQVEALIPLVEADYLRIRGRSFDVGMSLQITHAATADGDLTLTIDGTDHVVPVFVGDSATLIARRAWLLLSESGLLPDYLLRYADDVLHFVIRTLGHEPEIVFAGAATGVTATVSDLTTYYPDGAEMTALQMIRYHLRGAEGAGVASERLGDHAVTYAGSADQLAGYPRVVVGSIRRFVGWQ